MHRRASVCITSIIFSKPAHRYIRTVRDVLVYLTMLPTERCMTPSVSSNAMNWPSISFADSGVEMLAS